ncbi:MAG: flagellar protein FlaG [Rhodospirillaceae bacterium]
MQMSSAVGPGAGSVTVGLPPVRSAPASVQDGRDPARPVKTSDAPPPDAKPTGGPPPGESKPAKPPATVNPTFRYDTDAQRMIMMVHDQTSGSIVQQIPSEAALRQYEEASKLARNNTPVSNNTPAKN